METESSVSKSVEEKPPNTPDVSAQDAEAMANVMLLDSPLPNSEKGNDPRADPCRLPQQASRLLLPPEACVSL